MLMIMKFTKRLRKDQGVNNHTLFSFMGQLVKTNSAAGRRMSQAEFFPIFSNYGNFSQTAPTPTRRADSRNIDRPFATLKARVPNEPRSTNFYMRSMSVESGPGFPETSFLYAARVCGNLWPRPAANNRESRCFHQGPPYAIFFLLLAVFYMRTEFPESEPIWPPSLGKANLLLGRGRLT